MAQQSARRGRENQGFPQCLEHALGDMDQARDRPYRPAAAQRRITGRTDGSIRLRATAIPKFSLATKGASTDGEPTFAEAVVNSEVAPIPAVRGIAIESREATQLRHW